MDDGTVPYIAVDRVNYGVVAPWPTTPGGGGPSLSRTVSNAYANDPAYWLAGPNGGIPGLNFVTNQAPTVLVGVSQVITLPTLVASLAGVIVDDGLPTPPSAVTATWSVVSGPPGGAGVTFGDFHSASTTASSRPRGCSAAAETAFDGGLTGSGDVKVTVEHGADA